MAMTGAVAANAFLGHTSAATESFHLEQEFVLECSDSAVDHGPADPGQRPDRLRPREVQGRRLRPARLGQGLRARLARDPSGRRPPAALRPGRQTAGSATSTSRRSASTGCPWGKYLLVGRLRPRPADAGGLHDGHAAADFSPSTALPADWVRSRDPFQGVDKKDFGFKLTLTADPPEKDKDKPVAMSDSKDQGRQGLDHGPRPRPGSRPGPRRQGPGPTGLDRHSGPR